VSDEMEIVVVVDWMEDFEGVVVDVAVGVDYEMNFAVVAVLTAKIKKIY
jgi:hypothetical protein